MTYAGSMRLGRAVACCGLIALGAVPAEAAVRYCGGPILVKSRSAESETAARRRGLAAWSARAARRGAAWASWRLANSKRIECAAETDGSFLCLIAATPCAIAQNPARSPADARR